MKRNLPPVILLHGLFDNRASWFWFKHQLSLRGIHNIVTINLSSWHSEEVLTELLAKRIDELRHQLGVNKVHLVGHSMGGIIARNYIQLRGGASKVDQLICLGSPHAGQTGDLFRSPLASIYSRLCLPPAAQFITTARAGHLHQYLHPKRQYGLPNNHCLLEWAENIEVDNIGHTSLIYRTQVVAKTAEVLKKASIQ